ncbi:MAG: hypothetical protein WCO65_03225 [bacterium]
MKKLLMIVLVLVLIVATGAIFLFYNPQFKPAWLSWKKEKPTGGIIYDTPTSDGSGDTLVNHNQTTQQVIKKPAEKSVEKSKTGKSSKTEKKSTANTKVSKKEKPTVKKIQNVENSDENTQTHQQLLNILKNQQVNNKPIAPKTATDLLGSDWDKATTWPTPSDTTKEEENRIKKHTHVKKERVAKIKKEKESRQHKEKRRGRKSKQKESVEILEPENLNFSKNNSTDTTNPIKDIIQYNAKKNESHETVYVPSHGWSKYVQITKNTFYATCDNDTLQFTIEIVPPTGHMISKKKKSNLKPYKKVNFPFGTQIRWYSEEKTLIKCIQKDI